MTESRSSDLKAALDSTIKSVEADREALADTACVRSVGHLMDRLNAIAEGEGAVECLSLAHRVALYAEGRGESADDLVRDRLVQHLVREGDDRWSGRGNDVIRSHADGFRKQAARLLDA